MTVRTGLRWCRRRRRPGIAVALLVGVLALTACGAPAYTYVTNSTDHTYLKVPAAWAEIDQAQLDPSNAGKDRGFWVEGYDAASPPTSQHLFGATSDAPALLVAVQAVPAAIRGQVSFDGMRDFFYPVSASARQMAGMTAQTATLSDFGLVSDETLTPGHGLRGVHSVYSYRIAGGPPQLFDQTVYVNDDSSKLYLFFVRCSADCYKQRAREISNVVSSFTVRETP